MKRREEGQDRPTVRRIVARRANGAIDGDLSDKWRSALVRSCSLRASSTCTCVRSHGHIGPVLRAVLYSMLSCALAVALVHSRCTCVPRAPTCSSFFFPNSPCLPRVSLSRLFLPQTAFPSGYVLPCRPAMFRATCSCFVASAVQPVFRPPRAFVGARTHAPKSAWHSTPSRKRRTHFFFILLEFGGNPAGNHAGHLLSFPPLPALSLPSPVPPCENCGTRVAVRLFESAREDKE
jgi:hypothetical protein